MAERQESDLLHSGSGMGPGPIRKARFAAMLQQSAGVGLGSYGRQVDAACATCRPHLIFSAHYGIASAGALGERTPHRATLGLGAPRNECIPAFV